MGAWSAVRTSSSWTAVAVWVTGMCRRRELGGARASRPKVEEEVALEEEARADLIWASSWIGWPSSSTVKVTSAVSPFASTPVTLPTLTPAIRTGEYVLNVAAFSNVAWSS